MTKYFCLSLLVFLIIACQNTESSDESATESEVSFWFPQFPESPLLNLVFNEDIANSIHKLEASDWKRNPGTNDFDSQEHSAKIILSEGEELSEFKIVFMNKKDTFIQEIDKFLAKNQRRSQKKGDFSVYSFESTTTIFDITTFVFEDIYRLHFKPKSLH